MSACLVRRAEHACLSCYILSDSCFVVQSLQTTVIQSMFYVG